MDVCSVTSSYLYYLQHEYRDSMGLQYGSDFSGFEDNYQTLRMRELKTLAAEAGDTPTVQRLRGFFCVEAICTLVNRAANECRYKDFIQMPLGPGSNDLETRSWLSLTRLLRKLEESQDQINSLELESRIRWKGLGSGGAAVQMDLGMLGRISDMTVLAVEAVMVLRPSLKRFRSVGRTGELLAIAAKQSRYGAKDMLNLAHYLVKVDERNPVRGWRIPLT